jgi:hypothetical protein
MNEEHVIPVDYVLDHEESEVCICGPEIKSVKREDGSRGWVIVHHALDGREKVE